MLAGGTTTVLTAADLPVLAARHGSLLMWHGWSDPHISPTNSIAYALAVADRMGAAAEATLRLFLIPACTTVAPATGSPASMPSAHS